MALTAVLVAAAVVAALWAYSSYRHNYWQARGVPTAPHALPFIGHIYKLMSTKQRAWHYLDELYWQHGGSRFCGIYYMLRPKLVVGDPELIKAIMVKDFDYFVDRFRAKLTTKRDDIIREILTLAKGEHWRGVRSVLSPAFTSGRLKGMFPLVKVKADGLVDSIARQRKDNPCLSLRHAFGLYTLEVISSCAFGMETNTLNDGKSVFNTKAENLLSPRRTLRLMLFVLAPRLSQALGFSVSQPEITFFKDVVEEAIKRREEKKSPEKRGDFLDLMMEAREEASSKYPIKNKTVVANSIMFILAGHDTTSTSLSFVAFQLARHPEQQARVRQELRDLLRQHGTLTYQGLMEAPVLDAVISESLRLTPPSHFIERVCTRSYQVPGADLTIPAGMSVRVPVWSLHHDPRYWHHPEAFIPDRFLPENKHNITFGTYLPFGIGPRNCVATRFGLMALKLGLAKVLLHYEMSCEPGREELVFCKHMGILKPDEDTSLVFTPLPEEHFEK